ncbi:hypothetical protein V5799_024491 [Amblyomma americanum]|uniref:Uncharacterized protein n=1 Tax=Amblyomma americanum TaxID=6943 RepID=A0AAQ4EBZ3_AMBAM
MGPTMSMHPYRCVRQSSFAGCDNRHSTYCKNVTRRRHRTADEPGFGGVPFLRAALVKQLPFFVSLLFRRPFPRWHLFRRRDDSHRTQRGRP